MSFDCFVSLFNILSKQIAIILFLNVSRYVRWPICFRFKGCLPESTSGIIRASNVWPDVESDDIWGVVFRLPSVVVAIWSTTFVAAHKNNPLLWVFRKKLKSNNIMFSLLLIFVNYKRQEWWPASIASGFYEVFPNSARTSQQKGVGDNI